MPATQPPPEILIVDDDAGLRSLLTDYLEREGFRAKAVADGKAMDRILAERSFDLIILDVMLPGEDGLSIARRLRSQGGVPMIIVSAKGDDVDRIVGLEIGADDYLGKPFNPRELLARIRAVLRRRGLGCDREDENGRRRLIPFGPYVLDLDAQRLTRNGGSIPLTSGEYALLRIFAENPNRVLDRDVLLDLLKGYDRSPFDRSIDVQVARLRAKIEADTKDPRYIRTVWGQGYRFSPEGKAA